MSTARTCPNCGAPVPDDVLGGFCPKCVAKITLATKVRYFGDYELLEEIGRGGMGVVYRARQVSLNRVVAVKMILSGGFASEEFIRRFRAEASAAANLQHPNIVAIHEVGRYEDQHYFSMDFIDGPDLAQLTGDQPLPSERSARYVQIIAEAIHYAHQRGIIHRDLKPSNILIDPLDQPRVTDFGLAKQVAGDTDSTLSGHVLGAPSYMPPEQAAGKRGQVGVPSDVYALGAILYHLLTGRPPFLAETLQETLAQVQTTEPQPPRRLNPGVPRDLETICLKCLRKTLGERYASAAALAEDLRRWQAGEPILARPEHCAEKMWRWCRHHPATAGVLGMVGLLFLMLATGLLPATFSKGGGSGRELVNPPKSSDQLVSWRRGPDLPRGYQEARTAVLNGKLYVVGGRTGHGGTNLCAPTVQVYDPASDRWSFAAPLPEGLAAMGLAAVEGYLYCFGGISEPAWWGKPVRSVYRYDPRTDTWRRVAAMPIARSNFVIATISNRVYCAGGNIQWPNATRRTDVYDPATNSWSTLPDMPEPRGGSTGGNWAGKLVIVHGHPDAKSPASTKVLVYDPGVNRWSQPSTAQTLFAYEAGCLHSDGKGMYFAGFKAEANLHVWITRFNPQTGQVEFLTSAFPATQKWGPAAYDAARSAVYVVGGRDVPDPFMETLFIFSPLTL